MERKFAERKFVDIFVYIFVLFVDVNSYDYFLYHLDVTIFVINCLGICLSNHF